jgi:hypothetical protein
LSIHSNKNLHRSVFHPKYKGEKSLVCAWRHDYIEPRQIPNKPAKEQTMKRLKVIPALTILVVLVSVLFQADTVSAALVTCRGDPIFTLSNGTVLTVVVEAETEADNVDKITYTLHVPPGVDVESVIYSPPLGKKYRIVSQVATQLRHWLKQKTQIMSTSG